MASTAAATGCPSISSIKQPNGKPNHPPHQQQQGQQQELEHKAAGASTQAPSASHAEPTSTPSTGSGSYALSIPPEHVPFFQQVLQHILHSQAEVLQLVQATDSHATSLSHGARSERPVPLSRHAAQCADRSSSWRHGHDVLYMVNSAADKVLAGHVSLDELHQRLPSVAGDRSHCYPDLYGSDGCTVSCDVLVGSTGSYSNGHQDKPLRCASHLFVLQVGWVLTVLVVPVVGHVMHVQCW